MGQDFANKDKETTSGFQPGLQVPFPSGQHSPGKLYPEPPSGLRIRFSGNNLHLNSSPQLISSPIATAGGDKLPAYSYLSTGKKIENTVVIEDELEDIEAIKDDEEEREEEEARQ